MVTVGFRGFLPLQQQSNRKSTQQQTSTNHRNKKLTVTTTKKKKKKKNQLNTTKKKSANTPILDRIDKVDGGAATELARSSQNPARSHQIRWGLTWSKISSWRCGGGARRDLPSPAVKQKRKWEREREIEVGRSEGDEIPTTLLEIHRRWSFRTWRLREFLAKAQGNPEDWEMRESQWSEKNEWESVKNIKYEWVSDWVLSGGYGIMGRQVVLGLFFCHLS